MNKTDMMLLLEVELSGINNKCNREKHYKISLCNETRK